MGLEMFAMMLASSQLIMFGMVIGKSIMDERRTDLEVGEEEDENWDFETLCIVKNIIYNTKKLMYNLLTHIANKHHLPDNKYWY